MCALCAKYTDTIRSRAAAEWAKLYDSTSGFLLIKVATLRERLPPFIVTQYDASVAMILRKPHEITLQITDYDTAVATEMLATTPHQRRQGMLCLGTDKLTLAQRVRVLSRPFQGETRIIQLDARPLSHINKASLKTAGNASRSATPKPQGDDDNTKSPPVTGAANV